MLGVTFGSKHSYNDWGIWLEDTHINPPLPKRYIVDVPARNGLLDLTPELTPTIRFENRTLTFTFRVKAGDWSTLLSQIYGQIHGRTLDVISDLDPQWHWHGCVTVDDFSSDERTGVLVITVDADPFKLSNTENSYTVNGNGTITCVVDRMEISPEFEVDAPTTVIYGDSSYTISSMRTIEKTASGDIVIVNDGTANPVVDLMVNIEASQEGSGDPSPTNIRPIIGWDEVNVNVKGKNLIDQNSLFSAYKQSDGSFIGKGNTVILISYHIPQVFVGTELTFSVYFKVPEDSSITNLRVHANVNGSDLNGNYINSSSYARSSVTFTPASTDDYVNLAYSSGGSSNLQFKDMQLEIGSATNYEAYNGQTYTTDLNNICYGGTFDITTGVLTIDRQLFDLGTPTGWQYNTTLGDHAIFRYSITGRKYSTSEVGISSAYSFYGSKTSTTLANNMPDGYFGFQATVAWIAVRDDRFTDVDSFTAAMSGQKIVYPLETPLTVQLTPQQVRTVLNKNSIWADSGNISVTYRAQDFEGIKLQIPELEMAEGSNTLTIQGTGTTKVTYTNGRL